MKLLMGTYSASSIPVPADGGEWTEDAFIKWLESRKAEFFLDNHKYISTLAGRMCPLARLTGTGNYTQAAIHDLGISEDLVNRIIFAADDRPDCDVLLRNRMWKAIGAREA